MSCSRAVKIPVMLLRRVGCTAHNGVLPKVEDRIATFDGRYDHNAVILFPDLHFFYPLEQLLWNDYSFFSHLCLHTPLQ